MPRLGAVLAFVGPLLAPVLCRGAVLQTAVSPINGHTYHLLSQSNWTDAEAEANSISPNGHLATVRSQAENDWLWQTFNPLVDKYLWIGLNDVAQPGTFVWTSGEPITFTQWSPGEPSNFGNIERYTQMGYDATSNWNDLPNVTSQVWVPLHGVVEIVPEPSGVALAAMALIGFATVAFRSRRGKSAPLAVK